jgi:uncharacterized radical SAM superfamily Fe-S cluster-containing enzyme
VPKSIHGNISKHVKQKYKWLNEKLKKLTQQQTNSHTDAPDFYPQVINNTNIVFTEEENTLLHKGLKCNLHFKPKKWIYTLAMEAEAAITLLPV